MESLLLTSDMGKFLIPKSHHPRFSANGHSSFFLPPNNSSLTSVMAKKKKKKDDSHSFSPKPDESTGPFPEAVLLRERKVQQDGRLVPEFADAEEEQLFEALNLQLESDLKVEHMGHYEVVYLIHEDHEDEVENVNIKIQEFLKEKKGKIWRLSDWGMRRLAYKIKKASRAHYILMNFELEVKLINDFKRMLDKDERVIRHLVMKRDKEETGDCPPPPEFHTLRAGTEDDEENEDDYGDDGFEGENDADGVILVNVGVDSSNNLQNNAGKRKVNV